MVEIKLGKKYVIKTDIRQWLLYRVRTKNGNEYIDLISSHRNFGDTINKALELNLRISDATTLKELKVIAEETKALAEAIRKEIEYEPDKH